MALQPLLAAALVAASAATAAAPPNFVFLLGESTDGRLFRQGSPAPLPTIRKLQAAGAVTFDSTYSNAPVCCPSRASMLSGRYPHRIRHQHNNITVNGVWNNYEGLPADGSIPTLFDLLSSQGGYAVSTQGKTDWTVGGHSESAYLEAFTHNVAFPYNISKDGGWNQEDEVCASQGVLAPGGSAGPQGSLYPGDWKSIQASIAWMQKQAKAGKPFMAYVGTNIVHPPYGTNEYWYNQVDEGAVTVPSWKPLDQMHPCALQSSMLKGCTPSDANYTAFHDPARIKRIRRIYYAEVAEWDAMVGAYVKALEEAGVANNTYLIVTSDHGDMQLEQQSFYKMQPYEGSAHVPLLIAGPGITAGSVVTQPTQLLDLFPTIWRLSGVLGNTLPAYVDGHSLLPFLHGAASDPSRPPYVLSQFHGDDIGMSWFMLVQQGQGQQGQGQEKGTAIAATSSSISSGGGPYKYIAYGLGPNATYPGYPGITIAPQLFDLGSDPGELDDLYTPASPPTLALQMEETLRGVIDYPAVAMDVAQYQLDMFAWWRGANPSDWQQQLANGTDVRWGVAWAAAPEASLAAVTQWMNAPAAIQPCRNVTAVGARGRQPGQA